MTDITDIPYKDVELFFVKNKYKIPKNRKLTYHLLFTLIQTENDYYPESIVEWMMAYNLIQLNVVIPQYKKSEILSLPKRNLSKLSKLLKMKTTNIDHIINILKYLHKLQDETPYLDFLPDELLGHVIENTNVNSITNLCSTSKRLDKLCYSKEYRDIIQRKLSDLYLDISNFTNDEVKNYFKMLYLKRKLLISSSLYLVENNKLFDLVESKSINYNERKIVYDKGEILYENVSQVADYADDTLYVLKTNGELVLFNFYESKEIQVFSLNKIINIDTTENLNILNIKTADKKFYQWFNDTKKLIEVVGLSDIIQITKPYVYLDPNTRSLALTSEGNVYNVIIIDDVYKFNKIEALINIIQISSDNKYFLDIKGNVFSFKDDKLKRELSGNFKQISNGGALTIDGDFFDIETKKLLASNIEEIPLYGDNRFCLDKNNRVLEIKEELELEEQGFDYDEIEEYDEGNYDEIEEYDEEY